jgi:hypothetical protein
MSEYTATITFACGSDVIMDVFNGITMDISTDEVYAKFAEAAPGVVDMLKASNEGGRNLEWAARFPGLAERAAQEARWLGEGGRLWLDEQLCVEECLDPVSIEPTGEPGRYVASVFAGGTSAPFLFAFLCAVFAEMGATDIALESEGDDE